MSNLAIEDRFVPQVWVFLYTVQKDLCSSLELNVRAAIACRCRAMKGRNKQYRQVLYEESSDLNIESDTYNTSLTLSCTNNVEECFIAAIHSILSYIVLFFHSSAEADKKPAWKFCPFFIPMFTIILLILDATFTVISSREVLLLSGNKGSKNKSRLLKLKNLVIVMVPLSVCKVYVYKCNAKGL